MTPAALQTTTTASEACRMGMAWIGAPRRGGSGSGRAMLTTSPPCTFLSGLQVFPRMRTLPASIQPRTWTTLVPGKARDRKRSSRSPVWSGGTETFSLSRGAWPAGLRPWGPLGVRGFDAGAWVTSDCPRGTGGSPHPARSLIRSSPNKVSAPSSMIRGFPELPGGQDLGRQGLGIRTGRAARPWSAESATAWAWEVAEARQRRWRGC